MSRSLRRAAVLVLLLLTSCASPTSKYGGHVAPTVLRAGAGSASDAPGGDLLAGWADETEQSTDGALTLAVGRRPESDSVKEDGVVLERLRNDDLDVGIIRAPSFTDAGITSFQALQAPFLIDNEELARRVSTDPIATEMLTGLDEIGLVGLALVPGGLRHPVGWHQPLLSLDDFRDAVINTRPSPDVDRLFAALGASTDHSAGQERLAAAATGQLQGLDTSLLINITAGAPAIMTSNVVLYTKYDVVVMRRDSSTGSRAPSARRWRGPSSDRSPKSWGRDPRKALRSGPGAPWKASPRRPRRPRTSAPSTGRAASWSASSARIASPPTSSTRSTGWRAGPGSARCRSAQDRPARWSPCRRGRPDRPRRDLAVRHDAPGPARRRGTSRPGRQGRRGAHLRAAQRSPGGRQGR